jgi:hypothetical protein
MKGGKMLTYDPEGWILGKAQDILRKSNPSHFAELVLQGESARTYDLHCFDSNNGSYFLEIPWPNLDMDAAKKVLGEFLARELPRKAREHGDS